MLFRLLVSLAILAGLAVAGLSAPAPASALSCGPCPAMTTDALNLRDGPSLNANVLLVIPAGADLEYDPSGRAGNGYVSVTYNGVDGYAHRLYLLLFPASATPTDWLNLRSGPSLDSGVIMVMEPGSMVQVRGAAANGYFSVAYEQRVVGYAHGDYLNFQSTGGFVDGDAVTVNTNALNMRDRAGVAGDVFAVLAEGEDLVVTGGPVDRDGYQWYRVRANAHGSGWVAGEYLIRA